MPASILSSPVCLTVIWFLSWSLCCSHAQIWTDEVSGVQYGRLESNVTLACGKLQTRRLPFTWHHNHSSTLPWHKVTSDGSLVLLHVDRSAQGNYSCYDNQGLLLHSVKLRLGHQRDWSSEETGLIREHMDKAPHFLCLSQAGSSSLSGLPFQGQDPPGLLSISCQVPSHTHVRCSWVESVKTFLPAKYNASIRGSDHKWRPCLVDVARKHCDVDHPAFWQNIHTLTITESNALGSETTSVRFKLHELLKPDPPELVMVKEVEGFPKQLNISWNSPSSWPLYDAFPLLFHIRYRPLGSMHWSEIYSEESPVVIFDALAGHIHQVQVQARDEVNSESQWSEWSPLLLVWPWEDSTSSEPTEDPQSNDYLFVECYFPKGAEPETSTSKSHNPVLRDDGNLGLVILLVLFSVVILTTILSLVFVVWVRQRRRDHVTKQELTSMVKMRSMPI